VKKIRFLCRPFQRLTDVQFAGNLSFIAGE
jgi:hypothetical protein